MAVADAHTVVVASHTVSAEAHRVVAGTHMVGSLRQIKSAIEPHIMWMDAET